MTTRAHRPGWKLKHRDPSAGQSARSRDHFAAEFHAFRGAGIDIRDDDVHQPLLRQVGILAARVANAGDWPDFVKRLRRIYTDAVRRAAARDSMPEVEFDSKVARLHRRIIDIAVADWTNPHARRLADRLHKYGAELLTFVECEGVPPDNNHAEREIRPAVLMRKASYGNQSQRGADTRAILMTIYRTLKKRGLDPLQTTLDALRAYAATGQLPTLPDKLSSED